MGMKAAGFRDRAELPETRAHLARRVLPLALILAGIAVFFIFDLGSYLSLESLAEHRATLTRFVAEHEFLAAAVFVLLYALAISLSIPGGLVLTITGGFLFGSWLGACLVVIGATVGAAGIFLAARSALGHLLRRRAGPWLTRMEQGFRRNALSYLLFLRLMPVFPFFVVNLVAAFMGVSLRTFVIGTFFGIIPATFVYASIGAGLGAVLDQGSELELADAVQPEVVIGLGGLAILALLPVVYRRMRRQS